MMPKSLAGLVKELLVVGADDAAVDPLDDQLVLAGVQVVEMQLAAAEVNQLVAAQVLDAAVVAGGKGQRHDALVDAVEIDAHRLGFLLGRFGFLLFLLALVRGRLFRRLDLLDVVLVGEQLRSVLGQGDGVDARGFVVDVVELVIGEGPVEVALGEEIEVAPVAGEGAGEVVVAVIQQLPGLVVVEGVDPEGVEVVGAVLGVDHPAGVGRPVVVGDLVQVGLVDDNDLFRLQVDVLQQLVLVGEEQLPGVGGPGRRVLPDLVAAGHRLRLLLAGRVEQDQFVVAAGVAIAGDPLAVRGPGRVELAHPLACGSGCRCGRSRPAR